MSKEIDELKAYYSDREKAAREWRARGGKVVGYVCNSVPEELIIAAGMLPIRLTGMPGGDTTELIRWFNVNSYAEGFVQTMLNRVLEAGSDFLDYLVFPHATRNTLQTQFSHMYMMRELFPDTTHVPELYFIEGPQSWAHTSVEYVTESYREFKLKLEQWSGGEISQHRLKESIDICNESRYLLQRLAQLRDHQKVSGCEAMQIYGAFYRMERDEFNRILELFLQQAEIRSSISGKRIFMEGSPQDHIEFYQLVEDSGGIIVNEDNCWGSRSFEDFVDTKRFPDLIEALAQRYHYKAPCGYLYFPTTSRCKYCKQKAQEIFSDGIIIYILENDAHGLWDYVDQRTAFKDLNQPILTLKDESYQIKEYKHLQSQVKEFIDSL